MTGGPSGRFIVTACLVFVIIASAEELEGMDSTAIGVMLVTPIWPSSWLRQSRDRSVATASDTASVTSPKATQLLSEIGQMLALIFPIPLFMTLPFLD